MLTRVRSRRRGRYILLLVLIALLGFGTQPSISAPANPDLAAGRPYVTRNGIVIQAGGQLPLFTMQAPALNGGAVSNLSQLFSNIYNRGQGTLTDTYRGGVRYTVPNTATNALLEQYGATGGFYAFNAKAAFSETAQGTLTTA